jgi:hypothetical protein
MSWHQKKIVSVKKRRFHNPTKMAKEWAAERTTGGHLYIQASGGGVYILMM